MNNLFLNLGYIRCFPHLLLFYFHSDSVLIKLDVSRWKEIIKKNYSDSKAFISLLVTYPEFRNLFYKRIGKYSIFLNFLCRKSPTLFLATKDIGSGLFLQHAFSTIIAAKSLGENCWINQQVTIGYTDNGKATIIGDRVTVFAGAKVLGDVTFGNDVIIGANAVVTKDVPSNCTVVGVPVYTIKRDGKKVKELL